MLGCNVEARMANGCYNYRTGGNSYLCVFWSIMYVVVTVWCCHKTTFMLRQFFERICHCIPDSVVFRVQFSGKFPVRLPIPGTLNTHTV